MFSGDSLYPKQPDLVNNHLEKIDASLEQINASYPNIHRSCHILKSDNYVRTNALVQCNIEMRRNGNVMPDIQGYHNIILRAKL